MKDAGMQKVLVTGSAVGWCLNAAMHHVKEIAPGLSQVAVEDCCNKEKGYGAQFVSFPPNCSLINLEDVNSPKKVKVFFGMAKGKHPEMRKPVALPKRPPYRC
jgi:hypothetical protein